MKISKQKSPKFVQETEGNTQETFGVVDENIKENKQMNFQMMAPQTVDLAQESPSIGGETAADRYRQVKPNISNSNLCRQLNYPQSAQEMQTTFAGMGNHISSAELCASPFDEDQNPRNSGFQTKQLT